MPASWELRLGAVPVQVEPVFLLVAVLLGWSGGREGGLLLAWIAVVTFSVLAHELGHAFAFQAFGFRPRVRLHALGGETWAPTAGRLSPGPSILVSLAGPAAGLLLAVPVALARSRDPSGTWATILADLVWVNVGWGVLNLLPIVPLDGGSVLASVLDVVTGGRGERPARLVSAGVAGAGALAAAATGWLYAAVLAAFLAAENLRALAASREESAQHRLAEGHLALQEGDARTAAGAAADVLGAKVSSGAHRDAVELLAWARLRDGGVAEARGALRSRVATSPSLALRGCLELLGGNPEPGLGLLARAFSEEDDERPARLAAEVVADAGRLGEVIDRLAALPPEPGRRGLAALQAALHGAGRFPESALAGARRFAESPAPLVAYDVACSWARAGRADQALDWLGRAVELGFADARALDGDGDLDRLRGSAAFESLRARLVRDRPLPPSPS